MQSFLHVYFKKISFISQAYTVVDFVRLSTKVACVFARIVATFKQNFLQFWELKDVFLAGEIKFVVF